MTEPEHELGRDRRLAAAEAITGWPMSYWRLMKTVERGLTLAKIFNLREGFTRTDDVLPKRMALSQTRVNLQGVLVDPGKLAETQELYYQMLGWESDGVPTRARLVELGIEWAGQYLKGRCIFTQAHGPRRRIHSHHPSFLCAAAG